MYPGTLVSGFANISVYFDKLANNFKPVDRFFKRIKILLVILLHEKFLQFDWLRAVVRITILKYHSQYLCQISLQIMLLPIPTSVLYNRISDYLLYVCIAFICSITTKGFSHINIAEIHISKVNLCSLYSMERTSVL